MKIACALVPLLLLVPSLAAADPALDRSLPRPFMADMQGSNADQAWLYVDPEAKAERYQAILDLKTGCVVESIPRFAKLEAVEALVRQTARFGAPGGFDAAAAAEKMLADPAVKAEITTFVTLARRFGQLQFGSQLHSSNWSFSADGQTILTTVGETAFRSRDGGKSFQRLDPSMSRFPNVTPDGKWLFYERCDDPTVRNYSCPEPKREVAIVAADDSVAARHIPIGRGLLRGLDPTGSKLLVVRDDIPNEVTALHVDPVKGTLTRAFGIPAPTLPKNRFYDIETSPRNGTFGVFQTNDHPVNAITAVSMVDGHVLGRISIRNEMGMTVDDESGRMMWQTYYDDHAWARGTKGTTRDLGMGDPLGWAPGGRAVLFNAKYKDGRRADDPPGNLGTTACTAFRVVKID